MKQYDIFISYRRDASESAQLVATHLRAAGYRVFIDVEALRGGKFNEQLFDVIDNCKDLLVILPEHALDRCSDPEDWVRKEVCRAMEKEKNVIPVMLAGFQWPDPMPEGMESLKDYQAITATSREYFDLSMKRLSTYLTSRSYASLKKVLLGLGIAIVTLALLAFIGLRLAITLSLPFYTKVADDLTMQASIVSLTEDTYTRTGDIWNQFYKDWQTASEKEKTFLLQDLEKDLQRMTTEVNTLRKQAEPFRIELSPKQSLLLGLRDISADEVLSAFPVCESYFDDSDAFIELIREAVSDRSLRVEEQKTIQNSIEVYHHSTNIFYYGYLALMSLMPEKALTQYTKLAPEWRTFPNGVGLSHTQEEYEQYIEREINMIRDLGADISRMTIALEDELADDLAQLDEINGKYEKLYNDNFAQAISDTTSAPESRWAQIIVLSGFMKDALQSEKDPETVRFPLSSQGVLKDLERLLNQFAQAFPPVKALSSSTAAYYRAVAEGQQPYGGYIVAISETPKLSMGDIITGINGKKTRVRAYKSIDKIIESGTIHSVDFLRLEDGRLVSHSVELTEDEGTLSLLQLGVED